MNFSLSLVLKEIFYVLEGLIPSCMTIFLKIICNIEKNADTQLGYEDIQTGESYVVNLPEMSE